MAQDDELRCPHCGSTEIATRPRSGVFLKLFRLFLDPFECVLCHREFLVFGFFREPNLRLREPGTQPARDVAKADTASPSSDEPTVPPR